MREQHMRLVPDPADSEQSFPFQDFAAGGRARRNPADEAGSLHAFLLLTDCQAAVKMFRNRSAAPPSRPDTGATEAAASAFGW